MVMGGDRAGRESRRRQGRRACRSTARRSPTSILGKITKWDDPAIAKLNPDVKLPARRSPSSHRSDGSGTTFNFTDYLSKVSADWKSNVGENTAVEWPAGIGAKGNEGVADNVAQTKGAIGYVEYAYAKQNNLTFADMINTDGKTVAPNAAAFQAAAANADWANAPGFYQILTDQPGAKSWPITAATFILMYKTAGGRRPRPPRRSSSSPGPSPRARKMAEELDYIPMPTPSSR